MPSMTQRRIPTSVLIASEAFDEGLSAERGAAPLAAGTSDRPRLEPELCPLSANDQVQDCLAKMRSARALLIATPSLDEATMLGSIAFELATEARQAGVPCFAVTAKDDLPPFDARILDLQAVLEASSERSLRRAGRTLAGII
jgi:hypothetical protein